MAERGEGQGWVECHTCDFQQGEGSARLTRNQVSSVPEMNIVDLICQEGNATK